MVVTGAFMACSCLKEIKTSETAQWLLACDHAQVTRRFLSLLTDSSKEHPWLSPTTIYPYAGEHYSTPELFSESLSATSQRDNVTHALNTVE